MLFWKFQLIGRIYDSIKLYGFNRRTFEAQGFGTVSTITARALNLQRTR